MDVRGHDVMDMGTEIVIAAATQEDTFSDSQVLGMVTIAIHLLGGHSSCGTFERFCSSSVLTAGTVHIPPSALDVEIPTFIVTLHASLRLMFSFPVQAEMPNCS